MKLLTPLIVLICALTAHAQTFPIDTQLPDEDMVTVERLLPYGSGQVNFTFNYGRFTNIGGSTNHTTVLGHNCASGGGAAISGKASFCMAFESDYEPTAGVHWSEWHLRATTTGGVTNNLFSITTDQANNAATVVFNSANLNFASGVKTLMQMTPNGFILNDGAYIRSVNNGVALIQQMNAAGTAIKPLIYLDNTDKVQIGGSELSTAIGVLYLKDGTMKVVTFGVNDSAGVGYKILRVVN